MNTGLWTKRALNNLLSWKSLIGKTHNSVTIPNANHVYGGKDTMARDTELSHRQSGTTLGTEGLLEVSTNYT